MAKKSKINVKLFKKILKFVEGDLRRLEMGFYGIKKDTDAVVSHAGDIVNEDWAECGTKACCAGWAILLSTPKKDWKAWFMPSGEMKKTAHNKARKLLGLNQYQAEAIFAGNAIFRHSSEDQLASLRNDINDVLRKESIEDQV